MHTGKFMLLRNKVSDHTSMKNITSKHSQAQKTDEVKQIQQDAHGEFGLQVGTFMKWRRLIVNYSSTTQKKEGSPHFKQKQRCD